MRSGVQVAIALALAALVALALPGAAQGGVEPPPRLQVEPTGVYGVGAGVIEGYTIRSAVPDYARGLIYVAGDKGGAGFLAAVSPAGVAWSQTLEGAATAVAVDNAAHASLVAAATSLGDLIVVNASDPGFYAYYYRAIRGSVEQLYVLGTGKVVAVDNEGSLYIFKPPLEGWFEMAPDPGEAVLTSQSGVGVESAAPLTRLNGLGDYTAKDRLVIVASTIDKSLTATLYGYVFYTLNETATASAWTGVKANDTMTEQRSLRVWLLDIYYKAPERLSGHRYPIVIADNSTGNYTLTGLYPASYIIYVEYEVVWTYNENGSLAGYACYAGYSRVNLTPASVLQYNVTVEDTGAQTPIECALYRERVVGVAEEGYTQIPVILLDSSRLPEVYDAGSQLTFTYYPFETGTAARIGLLALLEPSARPLAWIGLGARYLLVAGYGDYAVLILLNSDFEAVPSAVGYAEMVYLGSQLTSLEAAPSLARLYLGTGDGRVLELTWSNGRYVLTGALTVSPRGAPVTTLTLASDTLLLAGTADGYAQLIDTDAWRPLWRGPAIYQGIDLASAAGNPGSPLGGLWFIPGTGLVGYLDETSTLILPYGQAGLEPLYPAYIQVSATLARLDGGADEVQLAAEQSYIKVYSGDVLVASVQPEQSGSSLVALAYLPSGDFTMLINTTSSVIGDIIVEVNMTITNAVNHVPVNIRFREVNVTVATPREGPPAYQLVYGPKPGAIIKAVLSGASPELGYKPMAPLQASGVTGTDGSAILILYDGSVYALQASLEDYTVEQSTLQAWGAANVTLTARPILYQTTITVIDAEVEREARQAYPVAGANVTITLRGTGRSITLQATQGTLSASLPKGTYDIIVAAPHYYPQQLVMEVTGPTAATVLLEPVKYRVAVYVEVMDQTGILGGGLPGARVTLQINGLPLGPVSATTGVDGVAVLELRAGTYSITVEHQVTQTYTGTITVRGEGRVSVTVEPKYSLVTVKVVDTELAEYGILVKNAVVTVEYTGPVPGGSKTFNLPTGQAEILLPYGYYVLSATAPGYQQVTGQPAAITGPTSTLTIPMAPLRYPVEVVVYFNDEEWSLATGPVPGAVVTVELILPNYPVPPAVLVTGTDGSATFTLRPGVYRVTVEHPLLENYTATIVVAGPVTYTMLVPPYYVNATIVVVDAETQRPVPGVTLSLTYLSGGEPRRITLVLEDGVFTAPLPAGTYRIEAAEQHYYTMSVQASFEGVKETRRVIALQPIYQQLAIQVLSKETRVSDPIEYTIPSAPLANVTVTLEPTDPVLRAVGAETVKATTGPDGTVTIAVRVGAYAVMVETSYYKPLTGALEVAPGALLRVTYALSPVLFNTTIIPVDPEMKPGFDVVEGATVTLTSWNGYQLSIRYVYGVDAAWLLLPAGTYTAIVEAPEYESATVEFSVPAQKAVSAEIQAVRYNVQLSIQLTSSFGSAPAAGMNITLLASAPLKNPAVNTTLGADGTAVLQLRRGNYTILAQPPGYGHLLVIGSITVERDMAVRLDVEAPVYTLNLAVVDAVYKFYGIRARVDLTYLGPYGSGQDAAETGGDGRVTIPLPAGTYQLLITAPGYKAATMIVNLTVNTSVSVSLEPVYVRFRVKVVDIDGKPVPGAEVILRHATLPYVEKVVAIYSKAEDAAVARVPAGVRLGNYTLIVVPPEDFYYLKPYTANITVTSDVSLTVTLEPKTYNVTIVLVDKDTGAVIPFTYIAALQRTGAGSELLNIPAEVNITKETSVLLPYGSYIMTLKPAREDYYILPPQVTFVVDGNKTVQVTLEPKQFQVVITVVDDRGQPLSDAMVRIYDVMRGVEAAAGKTNADGQFVTMLKYGAHQVEVELNGYRPATGVLDVPAMTSLTIELKPGPVVLLKRFTPLIIGVSGLAAIGYIILRVRERIAARLMEEEEYF